MQPRKSRSRSDKRIFFQTIFPPCRKAETKRGQTMSDAETITDADGKASTLTDVEIKDAKVIFDAVWSDLVNEIGVEELKFPKEIILLGGAPGAGKGTNTDFIMKARGFTCPPIVVSS